MAEIKSLEKAFVYYKINTRLSTLPLIIFMAASTFSSRHHRRRSYISMTFLSSFSLKGLPLIEIWNKIWNNIKNRFAITSTNGNAGKGAAVWVMEEATMMKKIRGRRRRIHLEPYLTSTRGGSREVQRRRRWKRQR
ncbi:transmembrane protein, putative [Medicago truncatula]|uniref:Transmembrane protein, putative n=1 Tax=Medicago truncatula TaxID=3880 RepID=G7J5Q4_MEDTR|nr:transmembrane protein, putative [Medicago truncatula]